MVWTKEPSSISGITPSGLNRCSRVNASNDSQLEAAQASAKDFETDLDNQGVGEITTEIRSNVDFFYAEDHHQQDLHKYPKGHE